MRRLGIGVALAIALGACAPAPVQPSAPLEVHVGPAAREDAARLPADDETFREHPPAAEPGRPFVPPSATRAVLSNGVPVLVVPQPSPFVAIRIVALGGLADVGADRMEVLDEMVRAYRSGTDRHSYTELLGMYAATLMPEPEVFWNPDAVSFSLVVPAASGRAAIAFAAELALRPTFDPKLYERWREKEAPIAENPTDDNAIARAVMFRVLFGRHPYGARDRSVTRMRAVTRAELVALQARLVDASRLAIVVAGGVGDAPVVAALEGAFGSVPRANSNGRPVMAPVMPLPTPADAPPRLVVVDRPGETIATIFMAGLGPAFGTPDVEAATVALDAVASGALGRLTARLRDQLGYAPWVAPESALFRVGGLLGWRARPTTAHVAQTLTEADRILRAFAAAGPAEGELADVREHDGLAFSSWFETAVRTTLAFSWPLAYGEPDDTLAKRPQRYAALSAADVRTAAARYLDPDKMRIVVVGDWAKLQGQLTGLGWGPIELRDVHGAVVSPRRAARASP